MSYQCVNISSGGVSVINISGGTVNVSNSNGGSIRCSSSKAYVSISGTSISITNSGVFTNDGRSSSAPKKKKKKKSEKAPKPPKPLRPLEPLSVKAPKALPPPPPSVASTTNHDVQPEDGYCWLLLFKSKHWNFLRYSFGPNTLWHINTPDNVLRTYMSQNPRMVSSRRDLQQRQTGANLYHVTPGGNRSPWDIMGF